MGGHFPVCFCKKKTDYIVTMFFLKNKFIESNKVNLNCFAFDLAGETCKFSQLDDGLRKCQFRHCFLTRRKRKTFFLNFRVCLQIYSRILHKMQMQRYEMDWEKLSQLLPMVSACIKYCTKKIVNKGIIIVCCAEKFSENKLKEMACDRQLREFVVWYNSKAYSHIMN